MAGVSGGFLFPRYFLSETEAGTGSFTETFDTTDKKDFTNTTAFWNPRNGNVTLASATNASYTWAWVYPLPQGHRLVHSANFATATALAASDSSDMLRTSSTGFMTWYRSAPGWAVGYKYRSVRVVSGSTSQGYAVGVTPANTAFVARTLAAGNYWDSQLTCSQTLSGNGPNDVYFSSTTTGVIVGDGGKIDTTTNSCGAWTARTSNTTQKLNGVRGVGTLYYAVGGGVAGEQVIVRSLDAGVTWTSITNPATNPLFEVFVNDANNAMAVGTDGVLVTTNASAVPPTWAAPASTPYTAPVYSVWGFGSGANGTYLITDSVGKIYKTTNSGGSWVAIQPFSFNGFTAPFLSVSMVAANTTGVAVGANGQIVSTGDGGASWTTISSHLTDKDVNDISCLNTSNCFAVGDLNVLKSSNSGVSWAKTTVAENNYGVLYYATNSAFRYGASGAIYLTTNGGMAWGLSNTGTSGEHFYHMARVPGESGKFWIAGSTGYQSGTGVIYYSINSGTSWAKQTLPITSPILSISMVKDQTAGNLVGYAVAYDGQIIKTTDGGANWAAQTSGSTDILSDIYCANNDICYVAKQSCGTANTYLYTTNGGTNWSQGTLATGGACPYYHIAGMDQNYLMFSGATSLQYTINAGTNWGLIQTNNPALPSKIKGVDFVDAGRFFGVGSDSAVNEAGNVISLTSAYAVTSKDVVSTKIAALTSNVTRASLTATTTLLTGHSITYFLSADGGANWQSVTSGGGDIVFTYPGQDLRWKATLTSTVSGTPVLENIVINYTFEDPNYLPVASAVSLNSGSSITLTEDSTTAVSCTATVTDGNGCATITGATAKIFRTGMTAGCASAPENCYVPTCTQNSGSCSGGGDLDATYTCPISLEYYADPTDTGSPFASDDWTCTVTPSDNVGAGTSGSGTTEINSLFAVKIPDGYVNDFGVVERGTNTADFNQNATLKNSGNRNMDLEVSGSDWTCTVGSVSVGNVKYQALEFDFNSGGTTLSSTPTLFGLNVCPACYVDTYWGFAAPAANARGTCSGSATLNPVAN
jgi:photosystem II stability/assembly factor-like uncharacterized protein